MQPADGPPARPRLQPKRSASCLALLADVFIILLYLCSFVLIRGFNPLPSHSSSVSLCLYGKSVVFHPCPFVLIRGFNPLPSHSSSVSLCLCGKSVVFHPCPFVLIRGFNPLPPHTSSVSPCLCGKFLFQEKNQHIFIIHNGVPGFIHHCVEDEISFQRLYYTGHTASG